MNYGSQSLADGVYCIRSDQPFTASEAFGHVLDVRTLCGKIPPMRKQHCDLIARSDEDLLDGFGIR